MNLLDNLWICHNILIAPLSLWIQPKNLQSMRTIPRLTRRVLVLLKHQPCVCESEIIDIDRVKGTLHNNVGQGRN
jgi:hypothetical protein